MKKLIVFIIMSLFSLSLQAEPGGGCYNNVIKDFTPHNGTAKNGSGNWCQCANGKWRCEGDKTVNSLGDDGVNGISGVAAERIPARVQKSPVRDSIKVKRVLERSF